MKLMTITYVNIIILLLCGNLYALEYFRFDAESGYKYLGSVNAHPGGGFFNRLGGDITKPEGTGCSDSNSYHNTVISSETAARNSITGSNYSLKTPYSGSCPNESFSRDTTVIQLSQNVSEFYIRWYQKWTGDWNSATVQQKFAKFTQLGGSDEVSAGYFTFSGGSKIWRCSIPNLEGRFDHDGITRYAGRIWIYAKKPSAYNGCNRSYDDINNAIGSGGTDEDFVFQTNQWYCIEIHVKMNSNANTADAVTEAWIDGKKVFGVYNFKYYNTGTGYKIGNFEMKHIYYNRSANDQPTYMDNIVIANQYIGPEGAASKTSPNPPTGINVKVRQ
jgi:hypothetical protein